MHFFFKCFQSAAQCNFHIFSFSDWLTQNHSIFFCSKSIIKTSQSDSHTTNRRVSNLMHNKKCSHTISAVLFFKLTCTKNWSIQVSHSIFLMFQSCKKYVHSGNHTNIWPRNKTNIFHSQHFLSSVCIEEKYIWISSSEFFSYFHFFFNLMFWKQWSLTQSISSFRSFSFPLFWILGPWNQSLTHILP